MSISVLNTDAGLTGKTLLDAEDGQTVTGLKTFDRDPNPPFAVTSGSTNVANLDADKVDGVDVVTLVANRVPYAASASSLTNSSSLTFDGTTLTAPAASLTNGQLVFPAAQNASSGVNTLDDYEEGSWTPVIGGSGGTSGQSYTTQTGSYIKIGRLVVAPFNVQLSAKGTITTNVQIQGLPFTSASGSFNMHGGSFVYANLATNWVNITLFVAPSTTAATLAGATAAANGNSVALVAADIANTTIFEGVIIYLAAS